MITLARVRIIPPKELQPEKILSWPAGHKKNDLSNETAYNIG